MQNPPTKTPFHAIYRLYVVIFILRWQHTMAIFTTLRLTVVLSTILPDTPDSHSTAFNVGLLVISYPFSRPCLSAVVCPGQCRFLGRFSSFWWVFRPHRSALPLLRSRRLAPLLCVSSSLPLPELISFSGSAHFPLNVSQTHFLPSPVQASASRPLVLKRVPSFYYFFCYKPEAAKLNLFSSVVNKTNFMLFMWQTATATHRYVGSKPTKSS